MKGPGEFYDAQEHQLNKILLARIRQIIAEQWAARDHDSTDALDSLVATLEREGFKVPVLYCEGYTRDDDPCGLRRYHEGPCAWT